MSTATFQKPKRGASLWLIGTGTVYFQNYLPKTDEIVYTDSKTTYYPQRCKSSLILHRKTREKNFRNK